MRRMLGAAALIAVATSVALPVQVPAGAASAPPAPTFGVPRIVDPIHTYGEPDIKVAPNGDVHVSGPQGTGVQRSIWNVSRDNGDSWRVVQGLPVNQALVPNKSSLGPGGGDTEIAIGHDNTVFYDDLWALTCFTDAVTKDSGATTQSNPIGCSHPPGDRQWMALFDPTPADQTTSPYKGKTPLVYLAYNNLNGGATLDKSTDGITFTNVGTYADAPGTFDQDGTPVVDQHTGDFLAVVAHDGKDAQHIGWALAVGEPDASGNLTFHYNTITTDLVGGYGVFFPVLVEDSARNLYFEYVLDERDTSNPDCPSATQQYCFHVMYTWASAADGWKTWSTPRQVDAPPSQTAAFAWAAAGGPGRLDLVWYGTDQRIQPSDQKHQAWNVYFAQLDNANSSSPTIVQSKATPHPMHYDDICLLGTDCITQLGNRNLADFFEVAIDHDGRARIVYNDTSNGLIQPNFPNVIDHAGAAVVNVLTQSTGRNAWTGAPLTPGESTAPIGGVTDPSGDALFKPLGGSNVPALDITNVGLDLQGSTLHVKVTTAGGNLGSAASVGGGTAAQLVVRWQQGNDIYYGAVEAGSGAPMYYAGKVGSVDLCSVSACDPHYIVYAAPPAGGVAVTGTASGNGPTTYDIAVPASAVGNPTSSSLLEEVAGFGFVAPNSASVPLTNAQADADVVPLEVEGTKTFNYSAAAVAAAAGSGAGGAGSGRLPATGGLGARVWLVGAALLLASYAVRPRRRLRSRSRS